MKQAKTKESLGLNNIRNEIYDYLEPILISNLFYIYTINQTWSTGILPHILSTMTPVLKKGIPYKGIMILPNKSDLLSSKQWNESLINANKCIKRPTTFLHLNSLASSSPVLLSTRSHIFDKRSKTLF